MKYVYRTALAVAFTASLFGTAAAVPGPERAGAGALEEVVVLARRVRTIPVELIAARPDIEEVVVTASRHPGTAVRADVPFAATQRAVGNGASPL